MRRPEPLQGLLDVGFAKAISVLRTGRCAMRRRTLVPGNGRAVAVACGIARREGCWMRPRRGALVGPDVADPGKAANAWVREPGVTRRSAVPGATMPDGLCHGQVHMGAMTIR